MVDDRPENQGSPPESERPKREPPTIDLEASEVKSETASASAAASAEAAAEAPSEPPLSQPLPAPAPVSPWIVAPVSGAVAAALVIGVGWMLGWPAVQPAPPAPQLNAAAIDDLTGRLAGLETKISKPAAPVADPAALARMETLEKSLATLRGELATTRAQSEKLAVAINEVKSAPRADGSAPAPDLSGINEQIAKIESAVRAQAAEIAEQASKIANAKPVEAKAADDLPLRRVVAAALLDVLVRTGDPYPAALAAALRNDFSTARRELKTLTPADRAAAQAWLDKADARDAALAASRQFAADAMNVLAKPAQ